MTDTKVTKGNTLNTPATVAPEVRFGLITATRAKGDRYNSAARAGVAHELFLVFVPATGKFERGAAAAIATATGFDAGVVSQMGYVLSNDSKARSAAGKFNVSALQSVLDGDDVATAAAVKVGSMFSRTRYDELKDIEKAGKPGKVPATKTDADPLADIHAWLMTADDEQFEGRKALVANLLATIDDQRADAAAKLASEELEAAQIAATADDEEIAA